MSGQTTYLAIALVILAAPLGAARAQEEVISGDDLIEAIDDHVADYGIATEVENWRLEVPPPPTLNIDPSESYTWVLETSVGRIEFELYPDIAPNHVLNTIYLSHVGFYDGLRFHRIVSGALAQAGCPLNKGVGGPAYTFGGEFTKTDKGKHSGAGVLSMANKNKPGTDGSEFFITFKKLSKLNGKHTVFGRVLRTSESQATLKTLSRSGSSGGRPRKKITIESARVVFGADSDES